MSADLRTLLGQAAEELSTDGPMDQLRAAGLRRIVRRRRAQRHTAESVAGVAAAGVVGAAAWFGVEHVSPPPPAHHPSPTVTSTPSPSPSPSSTPSPTLVMTSSPGLPPMAPLPDGLLEATTPGWVLAQSRPSYGPQDGVSGEGTDVADVVYLVSPQGGRYRVLDRPLSAGLALLHWRAGEARALVLEYADGSRSSADSRPAWLDLRDGSTTPVEGVGALPELVTMTVDGTTVWRDAVNADGTGGMQLLTIDADGTVKVLVGPAGIAVPNADGTRVAVSPVDDGAGVVVVDVRTGGTHEIPPFAPGSRCYASAWSSETDLFLACDPVGGGGTVSDLFTLDVSDPAAVPVALGWTGTRPREGVAAGDGRIVTVTTPGAAGDGASGLAVFDGATATKLPHAADDCSFQLASIGSEVYVGASRQCGGDPWPTHLSTYDTTTGATIELIPDPDPAGLPDGSTRWWTGLESWVVGSAR